MGQVQHFHIGGALPVAVGDTAHGAGRVHFIGRACDAQDRAGHVAGMDLGRAPRIGAPMPDLEQRPARFRHQPGEHPPLIVLGQTVERVGNREFVMGRQGLDLDRPGEMEFVSGQNLDPRRGQHTPQGADGASSTTALARPLAARISGHEPAHGMADQRRRRVEPVEQAFQIGGIIGQAGGERRGRTMAQSRSVQAQGRAMDPVARPGERFSKGLKRPAAAKGAMDHHHIAPCAPPHRRVPGWWHASRPCGAAQVFDDRTELLHHLFIDLPLEGDDPRHRFVCLGPAPGVELEHLGLKVDVLVLGR